MQLGGIKSGDIVFVQKKQGWKFLAYVEDRVPGKQELRIKPISSPATWQSCTAREVKKHYKLTDRSKNGDSDA